ncbi:endoplasmic reticulum-based factor for assembly of V-ATPase-domain-containing protein [Dipodascopsis uninucleata]
MVYLTKTKLILDAMEKYNSSLAENEKESLTILTNRPFVSHNTLGRIAIRIGKDPQYSLTSLLKGTSIYIPPKPVKKVDPEYAARMNRLRAAMEEQDYQNMIASAIPELNSQFGDPLEKKELKNQISVIINVLFSVVSVGFAIWTWAAANYDTGKRLLLSLFGSFIVLIAEVTLYMGYIQRIKDAKELEMKKKEIKKIVNQVELRSKSDLIPSEIEQNK